VLDYIGLSCCLLHAGIFLGYVDNLNSGNWTGLPLHWSCKWRSTQEAIDCIATMNGNPNLKVFDMHAWLSTWKRETIVWMGPDKMIPWHVCDKSFTIRFLDRNKWKDGLWTNINGGLIWLQNEQRRWSWGV
jgi:hypothetical protein